jgi:hypothetical protein
LEDNERADLERHLEQCASCRRELERLQGDMALLALSTAGRIPPRRARERLLEAVKREPRARSVPARRAWWAPVPWVAAAVFVLVAAWFWRQSDELAQRVIHLQKESAAQQMELGRAREVLAMLTATDALVVPVAAPNTTPQPQGKAIYVRDKARLILSPCPSRICTPPVIGTAKSALPSWLKSASAILHFNPLATSLGDANVPSSQKNIEVYVCRIVWIEQIHQQVCFLVAVNVSYGNSRKLWDHARCSHGCAWR